MAELVIFDCDGVLVDSERLAIKVDARVLAKLGWPITESEIIERFVGVSDVDFRAAVEARLGRSLPDNWEVEFEPLYRQAFAAELQPVEGIVEALKVITIPRCVASSGAHDKMRYTLGLTGLYDQFEGRIFSATEVSRGKPHPDLFLYAAKCMGFSPCDCVVVEDSVNGVKAASAAGMQVLAYGGGVTSVDRLREVTITVFEHMRDLPGLLRDACAVRPHSSLERDRER